MPDLDQLREATALIRQPPLDEIVDTARRRRHRAVLAATAAATVLGLGATAVLTTPTEAPAPASPAEKVVRAPSSRLVATATSLDDLDTRLAVWASSCPECAEPGGAATPRSVLALTTDAFAATTYVPNPVPGEHGPRQVGDAYGPRIESVTADQFLLVATDRPREWLVGTDGTVEPVRRVSTRMAPSDPRLWFRCSPGEATGRGQEGWLDPAAGYPWCALDPVTGTAYEWPRRWAGSVSLPVSGVAPWGVDAENQPTFAWWEAGGERHRRFLAESPLDARGVVWNPPGDDPLFFVHAAHDDEIDLVVPGPGAGPGAEVLTRSAPHDPLSSDFDLLVGTPGAALLAVRVAPETVIWRADTATGSTFEVVHRSGRSDSLALPQSAWLHEPVVRDGRIHVTTSRGVVVSHDDGLTWTEVTRWR